MITTHTANFKTNKFAQKITFMILQYLSYPSLAPNHYLKCVINGSYKFSVQKKC